MTASLAIEVMIASTAAVVTTSSTAVGRDTAQFSSRSNRINLKTTRWQNTGDGRDRLISIENVNAGSAMTSSEAIELRTPSMERREMTASLAIEVMIASTAAVVTIGSMEVKAMIY